jgi:hypothetical protein
MNNILEELTALLSGFLPIETGVFTETAPDSYAVLTPLNDDFPLSANNRPQFESQEVRISLYSKSNYLTLKNTLTNALINANFTITARQFISHEDDTKYFHYSFDVLKIYDFGGEI